MAYHINPETGNANICRAKKKCPFGDLETEHYATAEEARVVYEAQMEEFAKSLDEIFGPSQYSNDYAFELLYSEGRQEEKLAFIRDDKAMLKHTTVMMELSLNDPDPVVRAAADDVFKKLDQWAEENKDFEL